MPKSGKGHGKGNRYNPLSQGERKANPSSKGRREQIAAAVSAVDTSFNRKNIFDEFKIVLRRDKNVRQALQIMFPIVTEDYQIFETLLYDFIGKPVAETDVEMDTQPFDEGDEGETETVTKKPGGSINRRHASAFKRYVSELFKKGSIPEDGVNVDKYFSDNLVWFNAIRDVELRYSEEMAEGEGELIVEDLQQGNLRTAPQSEWEDLELGGLQPLPIKVDAETAAYLRTVTIETIKDNYLGVFQSLTGIITKIGYITIMVGRFTFNVSAHTLLWLITFFYDLLKGGLAGVFGHSITTLLDYIYETKEKIFGSPFMNIMDPTVEESKIRRTNRIVNIFLYTMIDLLIRVKDEQISIDLIDLSAILSPEGEGFKEFIVSDRNTWSLRDIYKYGSFLFNNIMASVGNSSGYHEWYNTSIKKVAYFVDYRIFNAKLGEETLNSVLSPLAIVMTAPPHRSRTPEQQRDVAKAEEELRKLGITVPGQAQALEPEPQDDPSAQSKKRKTRRRRKSKGQNSTKGKKKKGKKRKQTRRGRKKK